MASRFGKLDGRPRVSYNCLDAAIGRTNAVHTAKPLAYFESIGFDITTPPPVSGEEVPLGDIFTLSNAVEPPPELWGDDDDAEAVEC